MKKYPENVYVKNHDEIIEISKNGGETCVVPTDVCLDIYDSQHGLEHNDLLRAQYMAHYNLAMSKAYQQLLKEEE